MFDQLQVTTYSATLLGAKQFKGEIDGNKIDTCTVLVASPNAIRSAKCTTKLEISV
ncbi:hypothetical protein [Neisseria polysaccharea]|uniref:hypothetical protein n=1 Tax=Neisseria polysaccharea TaxID=489 RepID=UPI0027DF3734|nr:hypothetical protein [Neisseria polysaccharea]